MSDLLSCGASPAAVADTELLAPRAFAAAWGGDAVPGPLATGAAAPGARRAALAIAVVPPTALTALLAVVVGWIEATSGMALFAAGLAWLVFEVHRYLRGVDAELEAGVQTGPWCQQAHRPCAEPAAPAPAAPYLRELSSEGGGV